MIINTKFNVGDKVRCLRVEDKKWTDTTVKVIHITVTTKGKVNVTYTLDCTKYLTYYEEELSKIE